MTAPQTRITVPGIIKDHHRRIRRLEASPGDGGGSGGADCDRCDYVNTNDIFVPSQYRNCVDILGASQDFAETCDNSQTSLLFANTPMGFCSAYGLGKKMGLQINVSTVLGFNTQNIIVYAGVIEAQVFAVGWEPGESPPVYNSGWVPIDADLCSPSCSALVFGATFSPHNLFTGGCVGPGTIGIRWVVLEEDGEYRGALDDLPQAEDGDVIHFSSETHDWTTGPARRRTSYFMG